ncbi:3-oxoacyl-ACP synthase III family protein [Chitinophaga niabensis]|uniref:3-oxoacyl-[acyl-carrier-protein] synthase-3 n=1 Tax=Chitinophaga niabensis TaxID=536979 RepID=A0A1N6F8Z4_9BACT|nr:3-oxoacyl-[acyl-carrier-protein] synthase III C-terminal domain-containing protein [Chitinophaga niabensis]SIN91772.1 3-oxoacyl-[acyl-carrier-protein] synthase-3 [Chitinophaga niabensis]
MSTDTVIIGTGSYIPDVIKNNSEFAINNFYTNTQEPIPNAAGEIIEKFEKITGIAARRYAGEDMNASGMACLAAKAAIADANIDPETLDYIILAHNFGNVIKHTIQTDAVPSLASRVKHALGIHNPSCIPYDILFGCPGWVQGLIQAHIYFAAGVAKRCLVIGTETLSRVIDIYDRDSMIFSDGAGACVVEARENSKAGILGSSVQSFAVDELEYINMEKANYPGSDARIRYIKMQGRKVYEFALKHVPLAIKDCLDKAAVPLSEVRKIFIHQANEKMDEAIVKRLYSLYDQTVLPENIMPMNIRELGNSSVATVPTLFDMVKRGAFPQHQLSAGDVVVFASVGAGMNINAVCYRI